MYTDKSTIENYLLKNIDSSYSTQIDSWIKAMSLYIDKVCNRVIYTDTPETFKYDGDGTNSLVIKDCNTITSIKVNGTETEVFKYPANKPYTNEIKLEMGIFPKGMQNISISAKQSLTSSLPEDIKLACTILVAGIINNQIFREKSGVSESIGDYAVTYQSKEQINDFNSVKMILSTYKRLAI